MNGWMDFACLSPTTWLKFSSLRPRHQSLSAAIADPSCTTGRRTPRNRTGAAHQVVETNGERLTVKSMADADVDQAAFDEEVVFASQTLTRDSMTGFRIIW